MSARAVLDHLMCPISLQLMTEPVTDPEGNTYEKACILAWLDKCPRSPITRSPLTAEKLIKNIALANAIADLKPMLEGMEDRAPVQTTSLRVGVLPTRAAGKTSAAQAMRSCGGIEDSEVEALARALSDSQDLAVEQEMMKQALEESMKELRAPPPSYGEAVRMPRGGWSFKEDETWVPFDPAGELAIEAAYAAGQTTTQSQFFNPRLKQAVLYIYDLQNMKQLNTATGFARDIKRRA